MLSFRTRVDLGATPMKGYSAFPKAPVLLKPHCHIKATCWESLIPLGQGQFVFES